MTTSNIFVNIIGEFKKKGFDDASKATTGLGKNFDKMGKKLAAAFSIAAVTKFTKTSVKAFMEAEREAAQLRATLEAINLGFASPVLDQYIDKLELATGLTGRDLTAAFTSLSQATGDVTTAQNLLNVALDVSAATGKDLTTVAAALQRGYKGELTALARLRIGYTTAELKTKSFEEVIAELENRFTGSTARAADTFAGKMARLTAAGDQAREAFGAGFVKGLDEANVSIDDLQRSVVKLGEGLGKLAAGFTGLSNDVINAMERIRNNAATNAVLDLFDMLTRGAGFIVTGELVPSARSADARRAGEERRRNEVASRADLRRRNVLARAEAKITKERSKQFKEQTKKEKETQALKRAGTIFDMENIQIVAALQGRIDGEQRLRLVALLAINNDMAEVAEKTASAVLALNANSLAALGVTINVGDSTTDVINKLLNAQGKLALVQLGITNLPKAKNPFADWDQIIAKILADLARIQAGLQFSVGFNGLTNPPPISVNPNAPVNPNATINPSATPSIPTTQRVSKYVDKSVCPSGEAYYDDVYVDGNLISSNFVSCVIKVNIVETPEGSGQPTIIAPNGTILSNQPATFQAGNATILSGFGVPSTANPNDTQLMADARQRIADIFATIGVFGAGGYQPPVNVVVNVAGNVTTENDLTQNILDGLYQAQKQGNQIVYNAVAL